MSDNPGSMSGETVSVAGSSSLEESSVERPPPNEKSRETIIDGPNEKDLEVDHLDGFPLCVVDISDPDGRIPEQAPEQAPERLPSSHSHSFQSVAVLIDSIRLNDGDLAMVADSDLKRRIKDFRVAQSQRRKLYSFFPYGIVGLFINLSDTRADLQWAEDAAWRREEGMPYIRWKDYEKARQKDMNRCYFTYAMIFACTLMMLIAFQWNQWKIEPLSVNPLVGPKPEILLQLGALQMREMVQYDSWYRLVTAIFLHGGILHLVINLVVLGLLGRVIERNHGPVQTSILFFISAIGGNIISCLMQPGYILVGCSGGIFGLIGICVADIVLNWKLLFLVFKNRDGKAVGYLVRFCAMFMLFFDLLLNSIVGFTPFVDNFAHMGGFLYGFLMSLTVLQRLPLSFFGRGNGIFYKIRIGTLRIIGVLLAVALFIVTSLLMAESDGLTSPCFQCRYISCIPFPFWSKEKWWYCDGCDAVSGKVFRRGEDDDIVFTHLEVFCPENGEVVEVDISKLGYTDPSHVQDTLSGYCRDLC